MKNIFSKIEIRFLLGYVFLIIAHHILPNILGQLILILYLVLFFRSKHSYYWLALFTLIFTNAAGFFSSSVKLPYIGPLPFYVTFYFAFIAKFLFSSKKQQVFYAIPYLFLLMLMILLRLFTGFNLNGFLKGNIAFLMVGILPFFLKNYTDIYLFFKLIFIGVFIVLAGQLFHVSTGVNFAGYLFGVSYDPQGRIEVDPENFIRSVEGITVSILGLFGSVFLHSINRTNRYYQIIIVLSFLAIWLTATRGWMLASAIIVFPLVWQLNRKQILNIGFVIGIFVLLVTQVNLIEKQFSQAMERFKTLEYVLEGDITAGGTVSRTTTRHERVWNKFVERPILGWGYSPELKGIADGHVGNQNLLLQTGIVGYLLFMVFIFNLVFNMLSLRKNYKPLNFTTTVIIFFIFGLFMIHSTSRQMFGLSGDYNSQFAIAMVFTMANFIYYNRHEMLGRIRRQDDTSFLPT